MRTDMLSNTESVTKSGVHQPSTYVGIKDGINVTVRTPDYGDVDNGIPDYNDDRYQLIVSSYVHNENELAKDFILDYSVYKSVLNKCNDTLHKIDHPNDGGLYCNATWDRMQCWGYVKAGETAIQPCPTYIRLSNPLAYSRKVCNSDGEWFRHPETNKVWTNYTMCYDHAVVEEHKRVLYMYFYGFSISIALLIISLIIFSMFRQLKCVRVTLHKHMFVSYILTGGLWILYYSLVPMNPEVLLHNPIWCKVLHVLTHYMTVSNYAWMFCEGFYLHALIVIAFTKDKKLLFMCYIIGWVLPIIPTVIYTVLRAIDINEMGDNEKCWTADTTIHWILAGVINASLVVNFIFTINIMRILVSKLRSVHNHETMQARRAVRATLILIPLLGLQYIAFPFKPPPGAPGEHVYAMVTAFIISFQGVFVALVFCFFNGEVIKCFKKLYYRHRLRSSSIRSRGSGSKFGERDTMLRTYDTRDTKCNTQTTHSVTPLNNNQANKNDDSVNHT
ncbi:calcitonin gene-related peptide type 1 receptor-like isoform X2 [Dreissena polymorpha]|uniref:Calcitonin receptor n=2 Tax=Dreissena polymorpha TaxID=45954 RepID=A0A9D4C0X7_DREPO|nr:calcitonin gene-related peptide type 1 receptor-like isoform X2 [Dreissena polymorpha]KAH3715094.1 hypothetical protein DPMN_057800 [Dreissena polymorpha]